MFHIREAQEQDLPALSHLFNAYRMFYQKPDEVEACRAFLEERLTQNESVIWVAEDPHHGLVGFVQLYPSFSSTRLRRIWVLNDLFVKPAFRGQNISKQLIGACKNLCIATNACGLVLETAIDNQIGNQLYPSDGFVLDTAFHHYYWNVS
ncbi:MAG TPA: GNAT family N-acetyltransferase [Microscillaceae bacterium]|nr:GNAT family N-acetyltransferase [Microscillaceae bacterium]